MPIHALSSVFSGLFTTGMTYGARIEEVALMDCHSNHLFTVLRGSIGGNMPVQGM